MSTQDFQRKLNMMQDVADSASKQSSLVSSVASTAANVAKYTVDVAETKINTEIENARSVAESPEQFSAMLDDITKKNPVFSKIASSELTAANFQAQTATRDQKIGRQMTAEKGFLASKLGAMGYYPTKDDFNKFLDTSVQSYTANNSTSATFNSNVEESKRHVDYFYEARNQEENLRNFDKLQEQNIKNQGSITTAEKAQSTYAEYYNTIESQTGNPVEAKKVAYEAVYERLNNSSDPAEVESFVEAGVIAKNSKDYKYLKSSAIGRAARNKTANSNLKEDIDNKEYSKTTSIGIATNHEYNNPEFNRMNKIITNENNSVSMNDGTVREIRMKLRDPEKTKNIDSPDMAILDSMLVERANMVLNNPIEAAITMGDYSPQEIEAISQFVPIPKDEKGNVSNVDNSWFDWIKTRASVVDNLAKSTGVKSATLFSPEELIQVQEDFASLTNQEKHRYASITSNILRGQGVRSDMLGTILGDDNLNIYSDLATWDKSNNAAEFFNKYYSFPKDKTGGWERGIKNITEEFGVNDNTIPSHLVDKVAGYLLVNKINATSNIRSERPTYNDYAKKLYIGKINSEKKLKSIAGNQTIILPKKGDNALLKALQGSDVLSSIIKDSKINNIGIFSSIDGYRNSFIVEQKDFKSFVVYDPYGNPMSFISL